MPLSLEWKSQAVCRGLDPELFFPQPGDWRRVRELKKMCKDCPVRLDCLDYAIQMNETDGLWGGATRQERRVIVRNRRRDSRRLAA